jgi:hypothetical protein
MTGSCECGNKPSGSIKCGEFLEYVYVALEFDRNVRCSFSFLSKSPTQFQGTNRGKCIVYTYSQMHLFKFIIVI